MGGLSAILTALVVLVLIMAGYINPKAYAVILLIGLYALAYLVPIGLTYVIICQPLLNLYTNNELVPHYSPVRSLVFHTMTQVLLRFISHTLSLIHISEPTRPLYISYAVFCLKKKKKNSSKNKAHNRHY
eukprot:TRINITY_DN22271_c0_g1_i1.p2 TRINITY_DN22271_c0_g1~~TRINITY_DN22271_c0_g1_i1.p2  ORF type:complete len:130 (+),score=14.77 TRINITY_DN22271_c0_g1_i1:296-685(+)